MGALQLMLTDQGRVPQIAWPDGGRQLQGCYPDKNGLLSTVGEVEDEAAGGAAAR